MLTLGTRGGAIRTNLAGNVIPVWNTILKPNLYYVDGYVECYPFETQT